MGWGLLFAAGYLWTGIAIGTVGIFVFVVLISEEDMARHSGEPEQLGTSSLGRTLALARFVVLVLPGLVVACDRIFR